jgi:spore maturation protein CgeB
LKKRRIAILATNGFYCEMIAYGFVKAGHEALYAVFSDNSAEPLEVTLKAVMDFQPEFAVMFSSDLFDPARERGRYLAEFFRDRQIPVVAWLPDHPADASPAFVGLLEQPQLLSHVRFLCHSDGHIDYLKSRNHLAEKIFFPIDEELAQFQPTDEERRSFTFDFAFSGRHILDLRGHAAVQPARTESDLIDTHVSICLDDLAREFSKSNLPFASRTPLLKESLRDYFAGRYISLSDLKVANERFFAAVELKCGAGFAKELHFYFLLFVQNTYSFLQESLNLARLAQSRDLAIFGNRWHELFPLRVVRGYLPRRYFEALCACSKIIFSYTKHQLLDRSSERVLEALALGSFPLSNKTKELDRLFDKGEVVSWNSIEEAESLYDFYIRHESERKKISEAGRHRVFRSYTNVHWAIETARVAYEVWGL